MGEHELKKTVIVQGFLFLDSYGEDDETIYILDDSGERSCLLVKLQDELELCRYDTIEENKRLVSASYLLSEKKIADYETEIANYYMQLEGDFEIEYISRYSSTTGYLWTDSTLIIGGHNLLAELASSIGKYLYLEIKVWEPK